jgi:uncharacterized protein YndB with AHSA1/START domain
MHSPTQQDVVITRVFDAPRELVFRAWTEPEHLMRWWGPNYFTTPFCTIDLRPGGAFHYCMRSPDGHDFWGKAIYREVVAPERIVYTHTFSDAEGNLVQPTHYGMSPDFPTEVLVTVAFAEHAGKTTVTLRSASGSAAQTERDNMQAGYNQSLDKLAEYLQH